LENGKSIQLTDSRRNWREIKGLVKGQAAYRHVGEGWLCAAVLAQAPDACWGKYLKGRKLFRVKERAPCSGGGLDVS